MKKFIVYHGVAQISAGQEIELSGEQIRPRLHQLKLPEGYDVSMRKGKQKPREFEPAIVTAKVPLQFITGEEFGLEELPGYLAAYVKPIETEEEAEPTLV